MRKYFTLFFSVTCFLFACKSDKLTKGIIARNEMASLLTDVHIIDGRTYSIKQEPDSLYKYGLGKYLAVFKGHHTDSVQFRKSLKYYALQPDDLQIIYDQVAANLKKKVDSLNKIQNSKPNVVPQ